LHSLNLQSFFKKESKVLFEKKEKTPPQHWFCHDLVQSTTKWGIIVGASDGHHTSGTDRTKVELVDDHLSVTPSRNQNSVPLTENSWNRNFLHVMVVSTK
jgi:hypothetical protein